MKIAVVILNWNGRKLLEQFLPSVVAHSQDNADVYVADNASTDDSVAYVREHFAKAVNIIQNETNGGYAQGYNEALRQIKADIFVLLNSDVETAEGWLEPMARLFEDPKIAAAQPKLLDFNKKDHFEYAGAGGGFIDALGYPYCRGRIFQAMEKDTGQYDDTRRVFWASGACLFVRSSAFWEAGGLDPLYFAHQEEIDLCWRLRNLGYEVLYNGASTVYHVGGATLNDMNPTKTFFNFRNSLYNLVKNVAGPKWILLVFIRLLLDALAAMVFLAQGKPRHTWAIPRAHLNFYKHLGIMLKARKNLPRLKRQNVHNSIVFSHFILGKERFNQL